MTRHPFARVLTLDGVTPTLPEDGDVFIAPGAQVMGAVTLGRGVGIWFNAVLRGDGDPIAIGDGSNIQDGTVCHTDPGCPVMVGRDVTVGHRAILHGCEIGDGALVGMGAVVLNGAVIGPRSMVGANALVTEGKRFPEGVLILGQPAKVARDLTAEEVEGLAVSAERYCWNARRFRAGLTGG